MDLWSVTKDVRLLSRYYPIMMRVVFVGTDDNSYRRRPCVCLNTMTQQLIINIHSLFSVRSCRSLENDFFAGVFLNIMSPASPHTSNKYDSVAAPV